MRYLTRMTFEEVRPKLSEEDIIADYVSENGKRRDITLSDGSEGLFFSKMHFRQKEHFVFGNDTELRLIITLEFPVLTNLKLGEYEDDDDEDGEDQDPEEADRTDGESDDPDNYDDSEDEKDRTSFRFALEPGTKVLRYLEKINISKQYRYSFKWSMKVVG